MNNINLQIENFKQNFQSLINSYDLPIGIIYYSLKYLIEQLEKEYYATLNSELIKQQQEKQKEEKQNSQDEAN